MRTDPLRYQDEEVWPKIGNIYANHPSLIPQSRSLHIAIARLTLKAWDSYQSQVRRGEDATPPEPPFITTLRSHIRKRDNKQVSSATAPKAEYNPFNPGDASEDLEAPAFAAPELTPPDMDFNQMMDFSNDTFDWMLWDQLVRDPTSFPTNIMTTEVSASRGPQGFDRMGS